MLYPFKFEPQYKYRLWGGQKLASILNKPNVPEKTGESWEISGVQDSVSVISNGFLAGNTLEEAIEVYMGDLVGDRIYEKFGVEFPLLIKLIDAQDVLSIQVHPDDPLANKRHKAYGKTEMWYVIQADKGSELFTGFNKKVTKEEYLKRVDEGSLAEILNIEKAEKGDCFFIPAGRVHATGAGILFAEIQQTSDITYRIFDWNRVDKDGHPRELHTDLALEAIDFNTYAEYKSQYLKTPNEPNVVAHCDYFTTQYLKLNQPLDQDFSWLDSFIIYICLSGKAEIEYLDSQTETLNQGESILVPASLKHFRILPKDHTELLEVFIRTSTDLDNKYEN